MLPAAEAGLTVDYTNAAELYRCTRKLAQIIREGPNCRGQAGRQSRLCNFLACYNMAKLYDGRYG
jgi:hypothetical protein